MNFVTIPLIFGLLAAWFALYVSYTLALMLIDELARDVYRSRLDALTCIGVTGFLLFMFLKEMCLI